MNSLSYLSRQFDVLASTSAPNTPPSTPTGELGPDVDSYQLRPSLKRIRTWASARAFFLPQELAQRRHAQQPIRARKRSGSTPNRSTPNRPTPNSSRFQPASSVPTVVPLRDITPITDSDEEPPAQILPSSSSMPTQPKSIPTKELGWFQRLYFVRVILLFANWLCALWNELTRPVYVESQAGKGKGVDRQRIESVKETDSDVNERDADAVRVRQLRSRAYAGGTSYVRARASSIIQLVLQPQTKPPSPSPLSRSNFAPPPSVNLIPPEASEEDEILDRSSGVPGSTVSLVASTLAPQTPPSKRRAQASATRPSSPAKSTPLHTRKTLVLDLDETLIHSTTRPISPSSGNRGFFNFWSLIGFGRNRKAGHIVEVVMGGRSTLYHVYKRPFADYFLRKVSAWYTLVIFTASMKEYADPVIDWLDAGRGILPVRYFREHCTQLPNGSYSKDLTILNEDLARVCLIDNSPTSYSINKANGIPIEGWTHDPNDEALLDLLPFLDSLRFTSDVRNILGLRGY